MSGSVIGNTSGFGPEESRFDPWPDNPVIVKQAAMHIHLFQL